MGQCSNESQPAAHQQSRVIESQQDNRVHGVGYIFKDAADLQCPPAVYFIEMVRTEGTRDPKIRHHAEKPPEDERRCDDDEPERQPAGHEKRACSGQGYRDEGN